MRYFTILFDFDGTLADSQDIAFRVLNALSPEFGYPLIRDEDIPAFKKLSAWQLLMQHSGIPVWNIFKLRRLEKRIREEFLERIGEFHAFAGVPEMMQELRRAGYEIGVVSSNDTMIVEDVLRRANVEVNFIHAGSKFFGKARAIREAIKAYGIKRSLTIYVGDEMRDIEACKKVGIDMLAVGWGFNAPEALQEAGARVAATPKELLSILTSTQ